jgi:hypothetical protein
MTTPSNETDPGIRVPRGRRAVRIVVMYVVVAAILSSPPSAGPTDSRARPGPRGEAQRLLAA